MVGSEGPVGVSLEMMVVEVKRSKDKPDGSEN